MGFNKTVGICTILGSIAGIIATIITVYSFIKVEPNTLDKIPEVLQEEASKAVEKADLALDKDYSNPLQIQYEAATKIFSTTSKDKALVSIVHSAINKKDYKYAIFAAGDIFSTTTKDKALNEIVDSALKSDDTEGYAIIAAEQIFSTSSKDNALAKILAHYSPEEAIDSSVKPDQLSELEIYQEIFKFADAVNHMNMSEEDAKKFTDSCVSTRSYDSFKYFKKIFIFADSHANMDMSEKEAEEFALNWIDKYSPSDFKIFKEAFRFADQPAGMGMSAEEARIFAFKKLHDHIGYKSSQ